MANKRAVGIDLGTTYSAVSWRQESGHTAMVTNSEGDVLTPSVVLFEDHEIVVGKQAKKAGPLRPDRYAETVKRDMGNPVYSRPIQGKFVPPEVIQACILRQLKGDTIQALGPDFEAVITVPAFFDEPRRQATAAAGDMAGLNVIDIVNEPMAAALAFGEELGYLTQTGAPKQQLTLLVYDLGGGTFDVTLVELQQGDVRTIATDGDVRLGGRDWDQRLADYAAQAFINQHREDPRTNPASLQLLLNQVEEAKRTLSARQQAKVRVEHAGASIEVPVTRELFEGLTVDLVQRTAHTTRELLKTANRSWDQVQHILLVGGATRMPMIANMLETMSGIKPDRNVHPDEAVARGAAIYAHYFLCLRGDADAPTFQIANVNSHSLGVESIDPSTMRKVNMVVIPRNTSLPARVTREFMTKSDGQTSVAVQVLEGESAFPSECTAIGRTSITGIPPHLPRGTPVDVTFEYGVDGRLSVRARLRSGLHTVDLELQRSAALSSEHVKQWKKVLSTATGFQSLRQILEQYGVASGPPPASAATKSAADKPGAKLTPRLLTPKPLDPVQEEMHSEAVRLPDDPAPPVAQESDAGRGRLRSIIELVSATLVGLAIGYYILCCIRPEQYNFLNLPVPFGSSTEPESEPVEP